MGANQCYDMAEEGTQRLTAALGPSLSKLWVKYPNEPVLLPNVEHARESQLLS